MRLQQDGLGGARMIPHFMSLPEAIVGMGPVSNDGRKIA